MPNVSDFFDEIDSSRVRRAKELSEVKRAFGNPALTDPSGVYSKAAVVLSYANWEGFYNDCVRTYLEFLREHGGKVRETDWMLLVGALTPDFESLRAKNHSPEAKQEFISKLKDKLECGFDEVERTTIEARSNLNFERLKQNYSMLNFDLSTMQKSRIRLDKELVGWRHSVAHGNSPDLSSMDISDHVTFVSELLILIADCFQYAMLNRI